MLYGHPVAGDLGFSLNPFHYVKKAVVATGHYAKKGAVGLYHIDKAVLSNKLVQQGAVTAANAYAPGSGTAVQAGLQIIAPSGGTVATPAAQATAPASAPAPSSDDGGGDGGGGAPHSGGDQIFGMPKKYVLIGGGVLGVVVLLSLLRR